MIPRYLRLTFFVLLLAIASVVVVYPFWSGLAQKDAQTPVSRKEGPPNYDAFGASILRSKVPSNAQASAQPQWEGGRTVQTDSRRGVPTFLWASDAGKGQARSISANSAQAATDIESAARGHLGDYGSQYRLEASDVAEARLSAVHNTGKGAIIAKFKQEVGGIEVFRDEVNVIMNRNLQLIAISGYLTGDKAENGFSANYQIQPTEAIAKAIADLTGVPFDSSSLQGVSDNAVNGAETNPYLKFTGRLNASQGFALGDEPLRVKKVVYHLVDSYVPAYYVESSVLVKSTDPALISVDAFTKELAYSFVISAVDGEILFRNNLTDDAGTPYTYRVWADPVTKIPYDTPAGNAVHPKVIAAPDGAQSPFVSMNDVTLANYPFSQNDPWLPAGATETNGNNVDAFVNLFSPDGLGTPTTTTPIDPPNGDFRAQISMIDAFLHNHVADFNHGTAEQRQGSIQQLFYNINFLHDWYYDAGFDEASGNAQTSNFGRGGLEADSIKGQVQDFQSFNNANMLTPADGGRPRMRMYTFTSPANHLDIQGPAAIAAKRNIGISQTGVQASDITAEIAIATFTAGPSTCTITNAAALTGKIAMFDFDNTDGTGCAFSTRITRIHATGALAALMVYTSAAPTLVANITGTNAGHTKPIATISWNSAAPIKTQLAIPATVSARLFRTDRDGSIDNQIVFHEWGHYISNRLIGNGNGLNTQQSVGMGEGWGDFTAMLLTVRADDTTVPSNATWNGAYALATYATSGVPYNGTANNGYYYGIRRYPYSTDMALNPLTFKHIDDGNPLPVGPPVNGGGPNSEVHNTGEVWTTMLWEGYAALLRDTQGGSPRLTFAEAQDRMKNYLVAAYKMTPVSPTFLEARDAVLAAAFAYDYNDGRLIAQAFAKRGAGVGAIAPDRFSATNSGVTESYVTDGGLVFVSGTLDDNVQNCDFDGYLDNNEKGKLTVTIKNVGFSNLYNTSATVTSSNPNVTFPDGNTITFSTSQPSQTVSGNLTVAVSSVSGIGTTDFTITIQDSGSPAVGAIVATYGEYLNVDEIPASTATDNVESRQTPWTFASSPTFGAVAPWRRNPVGAGPQHNWLGPNAGSPSDEYFISPVFTVDGSGSMNLQFDHSWGFEFDAGANYDGGIIEMSVNGGAYADMGVLNAPYNGILVNAGLNPLKGRPAFVKTSGTIHTSLTKAIAPGSTVQIRFRIGTDNAAGAAGWQVDNIAFTGVVETPFATLVGESGICNVLPPAPGGIVLTPSTLPAGNVGAPYSGTLTASGGTGPYTFSVTPVILPPGLVTTAGAASLEFSGTPTQAGTYLINVKATDSLSNQGNANYTITIGKGSPAITWSNPADIVYGTALSATQLNASTVVPGTLTYTPASGTLLNAGNAQTLSVSFVPADTANYNSATKDVTINVTKATPTITWNDPADITYGTALSGTQLNASTGAEGTFTYSPSSGVVLNAGNAQTLSTNFVPADTVNYNNASKNVSINVLKATPTIAWNTPADITYGTALSGTQLNASANVPGAFTYTPASGTVFNAGNAQSLLVDFVPTDSTNYANTSKSVAINVLKATPTITWSNPATITYGTPLSATELNASASVAGAFTYTPASGTVVSAGNGQTLSVDFVPTDADNYNNASKNVTINVSKATPTITWSNPAVITYGTALSATQLNASTLVPGTLTYTPAAGTVFNAGNGQVLSVDFAPTDTANYNDASATVTINVSKAAPTITWSNPADITYGTALSGTQLNATAITPGSFNYTPGVGMVLNAGNAQTLGLVFIPTDTTNYTNNSKNVSINVLAAATTTSVASSVNPSDLGQSVTFMATVSSAGGIPTGTVQFKSDGTDIGAPQTLNGSGIATFATSSLTAGTRAITAVYNGSANFVTSTGTLSGGQIVRGQPSISISDVSITEGDSGTKVATFTATLSGASSLTVTASFATANGSATAADYQSTSGTLTFSPSQISQTISVTINGDTAFEGDDTFFVNLSNGANATIADNQGLGTILNDDAQGGIFSFSLANYTVGESDGLVTITVNRSGDLAGIASVDYATGDDSAAFSSTPCATVNGTALSRCDFTSRGGSLTFAAGESSKSFTVLISQDAFLEGGETFPVTLSNPTGGAVFASPSSATVTINDDATEPSTNPSDDTEQFVRAHYHDFLNREPDAAGLAFWIDNINKCNDPARRPAGQTAAQCIAGQRVNTSAAFFLSIEFQDTGYFVYRFHGASFGNIPGTPVPVRFSEFMEDTQGIGRNLIVGQTGWQTVLEANKQAFALEFVQRPEFLEAYPSSGSPSNFVDGLFTNTGVTPTAAERTAAINEFGGSGTSANINARARALRRVVDNSVVVQQHFSRAFVLMQYFGYLRRNPDAAPESSIDFQGYNFWLNKLNEFNGDFVKAAMVQAFITSSEYRNRFGN
jgi:hypothetical protein